MEMHSRMVAKKGLGLVVVLAWCLDDDDNQRQGVSLEEIACAVVGVRVERVGCESVRGSMAV